MNTLLIKNARLINEGEIRDADVLVVLVGALVLGQIVQSPDKRVFRGCRRSQRRRVAAAAGQQPRQQNQQTGTAPHFSIIGSILSGVSRVMIEHAVQNTRPVMQ